ncbi:hypothetical protein VOLCADRAFT_64047, partial [Volvox carteri f. nagariensis]
QVTAACEAVARTGFINYFGLQRFGTGGAPTHEVGRALLRCEYENAVRLVLTGRSDERPEIAAARRLFFEEGDAQGALRGIPNYMLGERAVLGALVRQGATAWSAAMRAVPRTLRMMYLHAWQSHVWNLAASHRWARGGLPGVTTSAAKRLSLVRLVTDADVAAGRYSVFDVVLPLPGTEVEYPAHETGEWIRKVIGLDWPWDDVLCCVAPLGGGSCPRPVS